MTKLNQAYGLDNALQNVFPSPIIASRVPTTSDKSHRLGIMWVNKATDAVYVLTSVSAGSATWTIVS